MIQNTYNTSNTIAQKHQGGFTLIEFLIYIALVSLFISAAVLFGWDMIYAGIKTEVQREVNQNIRLVNKRMSYEVKNASAILSVGANTVCLESQDLTHNPTQIYLSAGTVRVAWGGGSNDCTNMTNDEALTSNQVVVNSLLFTDRSSGAESQNIEYAITIESNGARQEWQHTQSITGTAELRSN